MYAYRIKNESGQIQSGFSDDLEIKAGKIILNILEEQDKTNHFLCVTRLKKGSNIGPIRFDLIKQAATEVLSMAEKPETPDDFYLRLT